MAKCLNCGNEVTGNYCSVCGQESSTSRFGVKHIVTDIAKEKLYGKSKHFATFRQLIIHPGPFISDYINGKRIQYTKPFTYFLFLLGIYIVVFNLMSDNYYSNVNTGIDFNVRESAVEIERFTGKNINYFSFILPVIFVFIFKLFLGKKTGINLAEAFVFSMYAFGTAFIFSTIFLFLSAIDYRFMQISTVVSSAYLLFALISFSKARSAPGIIKPVLTVLLSYFIFIMLINIMVFIFLKFKGVL